MTTRRLEEVVAEAVATNRASCCNVHDVQDGTHLLLPMRA